MIDMEEIKKVFREEYTEDAEIVFDNVGHGRDLQLASARWHCFKRGWIRAYNLALERLVH